MPPIVTDQNTNAQDDCNTDRFRLDWPLVGKAIHPDVRYSTAKRAYADADLGYPIATR